MDQIHKLALETIDKDKQAIIFTASRASAEKTAEEISKITSFFHPELKDSVLKGITPTKQCTRLSKCIYKGIAFHHSGLTSKQKELIEDKFKEGTVKIICATPTLAAGLSLPVFRVIIKSLKRFSGKWGMDWIPVLEYLQMAGRAGRPEYESFGEAIVVAKNEGEKEEIYEKYILGEPEEIYSKLAAEPTLRTYLLSLISSGIIKDETTMNKFFSKTFWAHQYGDLTKLQLIMDRMLSLLEEWQFITITGEEKGDFISALTVGNKNRTFRATPIGKRVSELYLDPLTANHMINCLHNYKESTFSLLQMISSTLEMRPQLRVKAKQQDAIHAELTKNYELLLMEEPSTFDLEYPYFINSIKTTMFFESWIDERKEDFLLETYDIRPGEIRAKVEAANWLLHAAEELAKVQDLRLVSNDLRKLRFRVKQGVKEELLPLLRLKGVGRIRARKLFSNNITNLGDLKKVDVTSLSQLVGNKLAIDIKKQIGEDVKEIPKGTRKGQLSMQKFT